MMQVGGQEISISGGRLWRIAILTIAGAIGAASYAEAAVFVSDSDPGFYRPGPTAPQRRQSSRRHQTKKIEVSEKESAKPQGPLIIAISIEKQKLRVYDANGFYAETPISTGMRGHPTPMGVFSIIQKHKLHHSNIYSNAPMPFMQRITWSGVAMHAGVLPGYPASHGCIRMPMAFAVKMWNWTKMGARVVVTPGELSPAHFSHPLLAALKVAPQPVAASEPVVSPTAKSDKAANADATAKPVMSEASAATPLREQTHTADAGSTLPATKAPVTMSDATPDTVSAKTGSTKTGEATNTGEKSEAAKSEPEAATAKPGETASSDDRPAETKSSDVALADIKPAESDTANKVDTKSDEAPVAAHAGSDAVKTETPASETVKAAETKVEAKADDNKTNDPIKSTTGTVADVKKDQTRVPDPVKPAAAKSDFAAAPKRSGQISVFISRKDQKLYVRQNFAALFEVPVTIAPNERPLGTHVFTAQTDKDDANVLHWSVVTLPAPGRNAERRDEDERASRRRKIAGVVEMKPMPVPDSPAEALDRLTIPAETMARIVDALSTGGSIIVSDQGINAGETGEGTDFIVSLR
jgi:lipoprotein-anchoring transpeptidase ErfK/SrfK